MYLDKMYVTIAVVLRAGLLSIVLAKFYMAFLTPRLEKRYYTMFGLILFYFALILSLNFGVTSHLGYASPEIILWGMIGIASFIFFKRQPGMQAFLLCSAFSTAGISMLIMRCAEIFIPNAWKYVKMEYDTGLIPLNWTTGLVFAWTVTADIAIFILSIRSITKSFTYKKYNLSATETLALILPCVPGIVVSQANMILTYNGNPDQWYAVYVTYGRYLMFVCIALLLIMLVSVRMNQKNFQLHMEAKDTAILREQIKQLHNQDSGGVYAEIRGMRHDMKNHLSNMKLLMKQSVDQDSTAELNEYIDRMGETLNGLDFAFKTGNSVSDVVIHQAFVRAKHNEIRFTSEFFYPSAPEIDAYSLAVILQNALENACEACTSAPEGKRFIDIRSRIKGEIFFMEISNSFAGKLSLDSKTGLPPTSKTDAGAHGLGLANIQRAAKKHQGDISIQIVEKDGIPVFRLMVALQGEHK